MFWIYSGISKEIYLHVGCVYLMDRDKHKLFNTYSQLIYLKEKHKLLFLNAGNLLTIVEQQRQYSSNHAFSNHEKWRQCFTI